MLRPFTASFHSLGLPFSRCLGFRRWAILFAVLSCASTAVAQSVIETDDTNTTGYTVPSTAANLLSSTNGTTLSANPGTANDDEGTSKDWGVLTDGNFGTAGSIDAANAVVAHQGNTLTYNLNTGASLFGYDIANIDAYSAWQDGGRVNQDYSVYYSTVSNPTSFTLLSTVAYNPGIPNSQHVDLAITSLSGVAAIQFVFNGQQNGYVGYRELAAAGTATAHATWNGGSATSNNWTDGDNWGGTAPTPDAGTPLLFTGSLRTTATNDFAPNSGFGTIAFDSGAAPFTLTGNAINAGGAIINASSAVQTVNIPLALQQNTSLQATGGDLVMGGVISGAFAVTIPGPDNVTLNALNTYSGLTTVSGGTLRLGDGATNTGNVAGNIVNNAAVTFANPASVTYGGTIRGTGNLAKTASGTLTLANGFSTYAGTTNISGGTMRLGGANAHYKFDSLPLGSIADGTPVPDASINGLTGTVNGSGASIVAGKFGQAINLAGTARISVPDNPAIDLHTYTISGWFNLNTVASGNMGLFDTRGGGNLFDLKVSGGVGGVATSIHGDIGAGGGTWINTNVNMSGLNIQANQWHMVTYVVTTTGAQTYFDGVANAAYSWNATPLLAQGSPLLIGSSDGTNLDGSIDDVYVTGNALTAAQVAALFTDTSNGNLPTSTPLTIGGGGTLDLYNNNQALPSLSGDASATVTNSGQTAATLTLNPTGTTSFAGVIQDGSGTTRVTLNGPGVQELAGVNTYTGATTVLQGKLRLASTGSLAAGTTVTIGGSGATGTPSLSGTGAANGTVRVNGPSGGVAGRLAPGINTSGNFGDVGTLTAGNLTLNAGSILDFDFASPGTIGSPGISDLLAVTNALTLPTSGAVTLNLNDIGGFGLGTYKILTFGSLTNAFSPTSLVVGGSPLTGKSYNFTTTGNEIDLTIAAESWIGVTSSAWEVGTNWANGAIPGSTTSTTNTDTATFNTTANFQTVLPDAGRNVQSIVFDDAAGAYLIGQTNLNALHLTTGGSIQSTATVNNTETVLAPLIIEGDAGSYAITNNAAGDNALNIGGTITGHGAGVTTLTLNGSNGGTVSGVISDGGSGNTVALVKDDGGAWTLTNTHTFTGGTTIANGMLRLGDGTTNGAVGDIVNNAMLVFNNAAPQSYGGLISGPGAINVNGAAALTLTRLNTATGTTTVNGPALQLGDGASSANDGNLAGNIVNNTALTFANVGNRSYGGIVSGNGTFTKTGAGTLTVGGVSTYLGATTLTAGTLRLGPFDDRRGCRDRSQCRLHHRHDRRRIYLQPGGRQLDVPEQQRRGDQRQRFRHLRRPSGFGAILQNSGNNGTFFQTLNFPTAGTYQISFLLEGRPGDSEFNPISVQFGGSTIDGLGSVTPLNTTQFDSFSGTFPVLAAGSYTIGFTSLGSQVGLDQTTFVNNVAIAPYGSLPLGTALSIAGGATFDLNSGNQVVSSLAGPAGSVITNSNAHAGSIVAAIPSGSSTFAGTIQDGAGQVNVVNFGPGSLVLSGSNTYTGATLITGGQIQLAHTNAVQNSTVSVNVDGGLTFAAGINAPNIGGLAGSGNIVLQDLAGSPSPVTPSIGGNNANTNYSGVLSGPGGLIKTGTGTLTLSAANGYGGATTISGGTLRLRRRLPSPRASAPSPTTPARASAPVRRMARPAIPTLWRSIPAG